MSRKKKKKKNKHSEIEEPPVNEILNGKSRVNIDSSFEDGNGIPERKSKKRKRTEQDDSLELNETQILLTSNDNDAIVKKRKKSKHRE